MKRIIIIGATSGIGKEVALQYARKGYRVGIAGRRAERLQAMVDENPGCFEAETLDVTQEDAPEKLRLLIWRLGGMDVFLLSSGVGSQNPKLEPAVELDTAKTNTEGFIRMVTAAYHFFNEQGGGHLAVISSIAGTKGLGAAPAYSATKRFQNTYIDALAQLARMQGVPITFTDIRPGFVATDLLRDAHFPMLMEADKVATQIITALEKKKRIAVIDCRYKLLVFFWRLIPLWLWERLPVQQRNSVS